MIGNNIPRGGIYRPLSRAMGPTEAERHLAQKSRDKSTQVSALRNLAGMARDAEDLRMLMDALNLPITLIEA